MCPKMEYEDEEEMMTRKVRTLKNAVIDLGDELKQQEMMMNGIKPNMNNALNKLKIAMNQIDRLTKKYFTAWYYYLMASLLLLFLLFFFFILL